MGFLMSDTPVREQDKFMLRLPDGMRERLKEEAAKNKRSLNAEIVSRIEISFSLMPKLEGVVAREDTLRLELQELQADLTAFMIMEGKDPAEVRKHWREAAERVRANKQPKP